MNFALFLTAVLIGFLMASPVGPIGIVCMRRTLAYGSACGFACGAGAALADTIYAAIATLGLVFISDILIRYHLWCSIAGGIFLCCLGLKIFVAKPHEISLKTNSKGIVGAFTSTFFLTLANPLTILYFLAIFAAFKIVVGGNDYIYMATLISGIFLGSVICWGLLSAGVSLFKVKFQDAGLRWINRVSGIIIAQFGLLILFGIKK